MFWPPSISAEGHMSCEAERRIDRLLQGTFQRCYPLVTVVYIALQNLKNFPKKKKSTLLFTVRIVTSWKNIEVCYSGIMSGSS